MNEEQCIGKQESKMDKFASELSKSNDEKYGFLKRIEGAINRFEYPVPNSKEGQPDEPSRPETLEGRLARELKRIIDSNRILGELANRLDSII